MTRQIIASTSLALVALALSACSTTGGSTASCQPGQRDANQRPCWVNKTPPRGVRVSGAKNVVRPWDTMTELHNRAIADLKRLSSASVIQRSSVIKETIDKNNAININHSSVVVTDITIDQENSSISTQIVDDYQDPSTHKLYLWVVDVTKMD